MREAKLITALVLLVAGSAVADEVRYFEQDGITYKETRQVVQRPLIETRYEQREQVFYREQYNTAYQQSTRPVQVPVTQYRTYACLQNRWNPFAQPYYTYKTVPVQHYETRQQIIQTPVTTRQLVPEKRIVQIPVTQQRMAQEEVITRVAVSAAPLAASQGFGMTTAPVQIGGVARLDGSNSAASSTPRVSTFAPQNSSPNTISTQSRPLTASNPATLSGAPPLLGNNPGFSSTPSSTLQPQSGSSASTANRPGSIISSSPSSAIRPATPVAPAVSPAATIPGARY